MSSNNTLKDLFNFALIFSVLSIGLSGCDLLDSNEDDDDLYVKFHNENTSDFTIISIELQFGFDFL